MNIEYKWKDNLDNKIRIIHSQIASIRIWVDEADAGDDVFEKMAAPYYDMLNSIYSEEYPVANALETSDLIVRLEGPSISISNPRLSLISGVFNSVRKQVTNLTKAFAGVMDVKGGLPKELDLGLSAVAKGSLILGFTIPDTKFSDDKNQMNLLGKSDPLFKATREAINTLGIVTKFLSEEDNIEELEEEIPDPKVRDIALVAAKNISPSGRTGVEQVGIASKNFKEKTMNVLTTQVRKDVHKFLKQPVRSIEIQEFEGIIREIDLDARRFELRRIVDADIQDIRCIYVSSFDKLAQSALNKKVTVQGKVERSSSGNPRLIQLDEFKLSSN